MEFKYIDTLVTPEDVDKRLVFVDRVAEMAIETNKVFDIEDTSRDSAPE